MTTSASKMIYCNLKGGLGNMLFQIAATKSLAIDNDASFSFPNLIANLQYLNQDNFHNLSLTHSFEYLNLLNNLNFCGPKENFKIIYFPFEYIKIGKIEEDVLIDGFFQSEKYFNHNRDSILDMFSFDFEINKKYNFLKDKKVTSIHVRRGDYIKLPDYHPTQSLEYYLESIEMLKNESELFAVFSDDINWCKENIKLNNCIYIEGEKDYIELYLMSICNNHIISNSSFSWWGAWLNKKEDKKVIGPKKWFGSKINHNTNDILPENWIKI
jgi:hypothetical protein